MKFGIGIDPSISNTGLCIIDSKYHVIYWDLIKTLPNIIIEERFIIIIERISNISNFFSYDIMTNFNKYININIEGLSFGSQGRGMLQLAALHFFIRNLFFKEGLKFKIVPPKTAKKFGSGNGNANKEFLMKKVKERWNPDIPENDNLYDAYVLAIMSLDRS